MQIPQSCELLATGPLAHLTTINPDGSPEVTVVWVGIDNDEFVIRHLGMWKKVQNIRRGSSERTASSASPSDQLLEAYSVCMLVDAS